MHQKTHAGLKLGTANAAVDVQSIVAVVCVLLDASWILFVTRN